MKALNFEIITRLQTKYTKKVFQTIKYSHN
jgi:hypothetical protein